MSVAVDSSLCPTCSGALDACPTVHGIVWVCHRCSAFAANLAVVRKAAPREFVKYLWLAATESGVTSKQPCPSCGQPLLDFGADVAISPSCKVCCRCFLLWFDANSLAALGVDRGEVTANDVLTVAFRAVRRLAGTVKPLLP